MIILAVRKVGRRQYWELGWYQGKKKVEFTSEKTEATSDCELLKQESFVSVYSTL